MRKAETPPTRGGLDIDAYLLEKDGERLHQTSIHLPVDLHKRIRKYAFDQEVELSAVMVDAIEARLDAREG